MSKILIRQKAITLRKKEYSYSQIKEELGVSKSTLSNWLKNLPLSKKRVRELRDVNEQRIERFRETMRRKKEQRLQKLYIEEKHQLLPLTKKEIYVSGLFLYWGEGNKSNSHTISINNSDPTVVQFAVLWMTKCLKIDKSNITAFLHLYNDMDIGEEVTFWSNVLKISQTNFNSPYIKQSKRTTVDHKGFGHGTCGVMVHNTRLKEKIMMDLEVMKDSYSRKI